MPVHLTPHACPISAYYISFPTTGRPEFTRSMGSLGFASAPVINAERMSTARWPSRTLVSWTLPCRGSGEPLRVLVLTSPRGGDLISNQFFDDRLVERVVIVPESFREGVILPPHHVIFNGIVDPDAARHTLECVARLIAASNAPVINDPRNVLRSDCQQTTERLEKIGTIVLPRTRRFLRDEITAG